MSGFSSEEDDDQHPDVVLPPPPPLRVDFLDVTAYGLPPHCLALSSLPGCRFRGIMRDLQDDLDDLKIEHGLTDVRMNYGMTLQPYRLNTRNWTIFRSSA